MLLFISKKIIIGNRVCVQRKEMHSCELLKGKLKKKCTDLIDDDLLSKEGKKEEIGGKLDEKLGKT